MHECLDVGVCICAWMYASICARRPLYVCMYVYMCICVCMYKCLYVHTYMHVCMRLYVCMYLCLSYLSAYCLYSFIVTLCSASNYTLLTVSMMFCWSRKFMNGFKAKTWKLIRDSCLNSCQPIYFSRITWSGPLFVLIIKSHTLMLTKCIVLTRPSFYSRFYTRCSFLSSVAIRLAADGPVDSPPGFFPELHVGFSHKHNDLWSVLICV